MWLLNKKKNWFEWEKSVVEEFLILTCKMSRENDDVWVWKEDEKLEYKMRFTYKRIKNEIRVKENAIINSRR